MNKTLFRHLSLIALLALFLPGCSEDAKQERIAERANDYHEQGDFDSARIEYLNLLKADPGNPLAHSRLGLIWYTQGAPMRAYPHLMQARQALPEDVEVRTTLVETLDELGDVAMAREAAVAAFDDFPNSPKAAVLMAALSRTPDQLEDAGQRLAQAPADLQATAQYEVAMANLSIQRRDIAEARSHVEAALEKNPEYALAHVAKGGIALLEKDLEAVDDAFKTASSLADPYSQIRLRYPAFLYQVGKPDKARVELEAVIEKTPDALRARRLLADIAYSEGDYGAAEAAAQEVIKRDPTDFGANLLLARCQVVAGEYAAAVERLQELLKMHPQQPMVTFELAKAYLGSEEMALARQALDQTLDMRPDNVAATILLAQLDLKEGNAEAVVSALEPLATRIPEFYQKSPEAHGVLIAAYMQLQRWDAAATQLRARLETQPGDAKAIATLSTVLRQQGNLDEAHQLLEEIRQQAEDPLELDLALADIEVSKGDFSAAKQRLEGVRQTHPESVPALVLLAKVLFNTDELDAAEQLLLKAAELEPTAPEPAEILVGLYETTNRLPAALEQVEKFLAEDADNLGALMRATLIADKLGEFDKAERLSLKMLEVEPDSPAALNSLAWIYGEKKGKLDEALDYAQRARAALPQSGQIADTLGWIHFLLKNYRQAAPLLSEASRAFPNNAEVSYHLAMVNYFLGNLEAAQSKLEQVVVDEAGFPRKDEAEHHLSLLRESDPNEATLEKLESLLKTNPRDPVILYRLAQALPRDSRERSVDLYERLLEVSPDHIPGLANLALLTHETGAGERARELADRARELAPGDPFLAGVRGVVAGDAEDPQWVYSLLYEGARAASPPPEFAWNQAVVAYRLGRIDEAREAMQGMVDTLGEEDAQSASTFLKLTDSGADASEIEAAATKILEDNPENAVALIALGKVAQAKGARDEAETHFRKALAVWPGSPVPQRHLAVLLSDTAETRDQAYQFATSAREVFSTDIELARALGTLSFHRGNHDYAIQLLGQGEDAAPLSAKEHYFLGRAQLETGATNEGRASLQQALAAGLPEAEQAAARETLEALEATAKDEDL